MIWAARVRTCSKPNGGRPISRVSSTTATAASSTSPSGTPSAWPTRGGHLGREQGGLLRQCPRRERQRPVQDRAHPLAGSLALGRPGRARDRGLGRLVECRAAPRGLRRHPAGRVRGRLPSAPIGDHRGRLKSNHLSLHETQCGSSRHRHRRSPCAPSRARPSCPRPSLSFLPRFVGSHSNDTRMTRWPLPLSAKPAVTPSLGTRPGPAVRTTPGWRFQAPQSVVVHKGPAFQRVLP